MVGVPKGHLLPFDEVRQAECDGSGDASNAVDQHHSSVYDHLPAKKIFVRPWNDLHFLHYFLILVVVVQIVVDSIKLRDAYSNPRLKVMPNNHILSQTPHCEVSMRVSEGASRYSSIQDIISQLRCLQNQFVFSKNAYLIDQVSSPLHVRMHIRVGRIQQWYEMSRHVVFRRWT